MTVNGVFVEGKELPAKPTVADVTRILGAPERQSRLKSLLHTYDARGLTLISELNGTRVKALGVYFGSSTLDFAPRSHFCGKLVILGQPVDGTLKYGDVRKAFATVGLKDEGPVTHGHVGASRLFFEAASVHGGNDDRVRHIGINF